MKILSLPLVVLLAACGAGATPAPAQAPVVVQTAAPVAPLPGDRDGDSVADSTDKCPDVAEDKDGHEDADGCPDPDNDKDGIADANDKCPNDAESKNGKDDDDGCPDAI